MKITAKKIYIAIFALLLIGNIIPLFIFSEYAQLTVNSIFPAVTMLGMIIVVILMYDFRHIPGLFFFRHMLRFFKRTHNITFDEPDDVETTYTPEYEKEYAFSIFVYCAIIPFFIPFIFFSQNGSNGVVAIYLPWIPFLFLQIRNIIWYRKNDPTAAIEKERKEQEKREELGKWK